MSYKKIKSIWKFLVNHLLRVARDRDHIRAQRQGFPTGGWVPRARMGWLGTGPAAYFTRLFSQALILLLICIGTTNVFAQATPINFVTNVDYNPHGQIIKVEYGNGTVTNYTYHSLNLRLQRIHTVNSSNQALQDLNYTYDSAGNILSITDAVNTATQSFQYDALNRLTQAVGALYGTKTFAYDQIGNILQKDGLNYAYGENGAGPHAVTSLSDGTTYQYDLNGNMIKKTKPTEVTDYTYDVENRLVNVKKNTTLVAEYFYDGDGGRVGKIDYTQTGQSGTCFLAGTQILMADGSARPIEKLVIGDEVIGFDEKLMKKVPVKVTQVFNQETAYDYLLINGHMKVTPNHKVYTEGQWKEIGNMKLGDKLLFADLGEHTIKSFEKIRSNEGVKVYNIEVEGVHNYFANGYLVHNKMVFGSQTTGKVTKYLGSLYENVDGQEVRYIYLGSTRVASINAGKIYYYHDDHLGGTNVLSNNLGVKTELIEYLPFGGYAKREKYGSSAEVAYYYFTGKPLDDETGLYYFGARYYDPQLGRFITADTIVPHPMNPQALNRYSYAGNNPVNNIDPDGHGWFSKIIKSFFKAVVQAVAYVVLSAIISPVGAGALVGFVGGGITSNGWSWNGALTGAALGGLGGAAFGTNGTNGFLGALGPKIGLGLLIAGAGYSATTGGLEGLANFGASVAGAMVGVGAGNEIVNSKGFQNWKNGKDDLAYHSSKGSNNSKNDGDVNKALVVDKGKGASGDPMIDDPEVRSQMLKALNDSNEKQLEWGGKIQRKGDGGFGVKMGSSGDRYPDKFAFGGGRDILRDAGDFHTHWNSNAGPSSQDYFVSDRNFSTYGLKHYVVDNESIKGFQSSGGDSGTWWHVWKWDGN